MTALGFYFRGLDQREANALRAVLNEIAERHGYTAHAGPTAGQGNFAAMMIAIATGEVALVLLPDEHFGPAIERLEQITQEPTSEPHQNDWAASIAQALRDALGRQDAK